MFKDFWIIEFGQCFICGMQIILITTNLPNKKEHLLFLGQHPLNNNELNEIKFCLHLIAVRKEERKNKQLCLPLRKALAGYRTSQKEQ